MPHPNDIANGGVASQFVQFAQASGVVIVGSNARRIAITVAPAGPVRLGYPTAVASQSFPVASGQIFEERDYKGDVRIIMDAAGATAPVWVSDVILP